MSWLIVLIVKVEAREEAQQALESIRFQLFRLHDGTGTLEGLRAELAAAREIGEAVDRLLAGRREIQQALNQRSVPSTSG